MQRVDDVTGEMIRLSATERERQRAAMTVRLAELTAANNVLYQRLGEVERAAEAHETRIQALERAAYLTRGQRLRWMFGW